MADLNHQDGVVDVHHVHAWTLTSGKHAFSAHIRHTELRHFAPDLIPAG
jgi:cobalt-zinc-cadmium efflux system protein